MTAICSCSAWDSCGGCWVGCCPNISLDAPPRPGLLGAGREVGAGWDCGAWRVWGADRPTPSISSSSASEGTLLPLDPPRPSLRTPGNCTPSELPRPPAGLPPRISLRISGPGFPRRWPPLCCWAAPALRISVRISNGFMSSFLGKGRVKTRLGIYQSPKCASWTKVRNSRVSCIGNAEVHRLRFPSVRGVVVRKCRSFLRTSGRIHPLRRRGYGLRFGRGTSGRG